MTLQALPQPVIMAPFIAAVMGHTHTSSTSGSGAGAEATVTFDAAGDGFAVIFTAQSTTMVDAISFYVSNVSVIGTAGDIVATVESLGTTGNPDGAIASSNSPTATITTSGGKEITGIAGSASLTVGAQYALVIKAGAGWDRTMTIRVTHGAGANQGYPYYATNTTGAWSKGTQTIWGYFMGARDASGNPIVLPACVGAATVAQQSFSNATNPDERGNRFTLAAPATCIGIAYSQAAGSTPGSADDYGVALYGDVTGTPTLLAVANPDGDAQTTNLPHVAYFDAPVNLSANTVYAVTYKAKSTDAALVARFGYDAEAHRRVIMGTDYYAVTRDGGASGPTAGTPAFTTDDTSVYCVWPIFSKFDDATGGAGGGMLVHPGMVGGMRG